MTQTCPGCHTELFKPGKQRFCGSCGEPINVDVDREQIRRKTSGFLTPQERSRIIDAIQGSRGEHHEYTHVHVQEEIRYALLDFSLITRWQEFDEHAALIGDIGRKEIPQKEEVPEFRGIIGLFRFLVSSMGLKPMTEILWLALREEIRAVEDADIDAIEELTVEIAVDGERATAPSVNYKA